MNDNQTVAPVPKISPLGRNAPSDYLLIDDTPYAKPQEAGEPGGVLVVAPALGATIKPINSVN